MRFKKTALHGSSPQGWGLSLSLGQASQLAYVALGGAEATALAWGFTGVRVLDAGTTQGLVAWDSKCVVVAFRGTQEYPDWIANLNMLPKRQRYGKLHRGFYRAFEGVRPALAGALRDGMTPGKKLWVTGHSLGGALATVMAAEMADEFPITGIHTFGQPRVVDETAQAFLRNHYGSRYIRFVNSGDPVTTVPPHFEHAGSLIWFDSTGAIKPSVGLRSVRGSREKSLSDDEFNELKQQMKVRRERLEEEFEGQPAVAAVRGAASRGVRGSVIPIADHKLDRYVECIARHASAGTPYPF
jgi:hypothetical protein